MKNLQKKLFIRFRLLFIINQSLDWLYAFLKIIDINLYNSIYSNLKFMDKCKTTTEFINIAIKNPQIDIFIQDYFNKYLFKFKIIHKNIWKNVKN